MSALVTVSDPLPAIRRLVLDSVSSPLTKTLYAKALDDFFAWRLENGSPVFHRAAVQAHRAWLEAQNYAPSSINQRLAALRKLAREAAANGWLDAETAAGIDQMPGVKQQGTRSGNWLTKQQAAALLHAPDPCTLKGIRDRAILAVLIGCALRRSELVALETDHVQQRDGRWVLVDLRGKHGRIRSIAIPPWVKQAFDLWMDAADVIEGKLFRALNRHGMLTRDTLSTQAVLDIVKEYSERLGIRVRPHDLRRTCAKLCRAAGGDLEQIQLLLGHASIQTTERYLGTRQNLADAPNDRLGLGWDASAREGRVFSELEFQAP
ncbi:MAG: tyrosine-type recombinase/integrase [Acidobacteriaceae bacterium]|nr:tyrosine-type recombinase/integrase [Acidobacteriaceae bacterium]